MGNVNIEKLKRMAGEFAEEYSSNGLINISINSDRKSVHLTHRGFIKTFDSWKVKTFGEPEENTQEFYTEIDGVVFFCLARTV